MMGPVFIVNEARVKWTVTRFPVFIIYMCHVTITFIEVRSSEVCFIDRVMEPGRPTWVHITELILH